MPPPLGRKPCPSPPDGSAIDMAGPLRLRQLSSEMTLLPRRADGDNDGHLRSTQLPSGRRHSIGLHTQFIHNRCSKQHNALHYFKSGTTKSQKRFRYYEDDKKFNNNRLRPSRAVNHAPND